MISEVTKNATECFSTLEKGSSDCNKPEIRVYKKRFWMLFLYSFLSLLSGMVYPQYVSDADVNVCYYGVSQDAVNWTAMMVMVVYVVLVVPATSVINYIDLKWTVVLGALFNTAACALQLATLKPNGFIFVMISSFFAALCNLLVMGLPPFIASRWFPDNELSRACAVGVIGNQLGTAVGFIFSPLLVSSDCSKTEEIESGKRVIAIILTVVNVIVLLLTVTTFQNAPRNPPNYNNGRNSAGTIKNQIRITMKMFTNLQFVLIFIAYGLMVGCYCAYGTTLNDLILHHFPGKEIEIGWMGSLMVFTGILGAGVTGYILDLTKRYKETYLGICVLLFISYVIFTGLFYVHEISVQFVTIGVLGLFFTSVMPVGFEYAIEVTYPDSEVVSVNLLTASRMLFGLILTEIVSAVLDTMGPTYSNFLICASLLICCIISGFFTTDYRRTKHNQEKSIKQDSKSFNKK